MNIQLTEREQTSALNYLNDWTRCAKRDCNNAIANSTENMHLAQRGLVLVEQVEKILTDPAAKFAEINSQIAQLHTRFVAQLAQTQDALEIIALDMTIETLHAFLNWAR